MKTRPDTFLGRLATAARPSRPWLRIHASNWWTRVFLVGGARRRPLIGEDLIGADLGGGMGSGAASSSRLTGGSQVHDVVRDVVVEIAPEERPLVDALAQLDDATVARWLRRRVRREPLAFGLSEIAALVTPVVWRVVDQAAQQLGDAAATGARAPLRRLFHRRAVSAEVPQLTREQLAWVHQQVLQKAAQQGLEEERAYAVADAVVARLVLAVPEGPVQEPVGRDGSTCDSPPTA